MNDIPYNYNNKQNYVNLLQKEFLKLQKDYSFRNFWKINKEHDDLKYSHKALIDKHNRLVKRLKETLEENKNIKKIKD